MADNDESIFDFDNILGVTDVFDKVNKELDDLEKRMVKFAKTLDSAFKKMSPNDDEGVEKTVKQLKQLETVQKSINTQREANNKTKKKAIDLTEDELIAREKERKARREKVKLAKIQIVLNDKEAGQIEKLRAKLAETTIDWKKLSKAELENGKEGRRLIKRKKQLTDQLKRLEKQTGDTRRNVGNYTQSLGKLGKVAARIFVGRTVIDGIRRVGGAFVELFEQNKEGNESFQKFGNTVTVLIDRIKGIGLAIIETVLPFVQAVIRRFQFFSKAISDAAGEGTILGTVFEGIKTAVVAVINTILDLPFIFAGVKGAVVAVADSMKAQFSIMGLDAEKLKLKIKDAFSAITGADSASINRRLREIDQAISENNRKIILSAGQLGDAYRKASDEARAAFAEFEKEQDEADKKAAEAANKIAGSSERRKAAIEAANQLLVKQNALLEKTKKSELERVKAIEVIQDKLIKAEAQGIEDRQERALALEDTKFQAEQKAMQANFDIRINLIEQQENELIALFGENSKQVIAFRNQAAKDILEIERLNQQLSEKQLEASEQRKLDIIKKFEAERVAAITKTVKQAQGLIKKQTLEDEKIILDSIKKVQAEVNQVEEDLAAKRKKRNEETKESTKQLLDAVNQISESVGSAIVQVFEKQAEAAAKLVNDQSEAVETQRKRAEAGLQNTLKFEQETLAQREAEKQRAQKKAENAAKILALINMVSAAAQSGDENAVATALVQFALLEALTAGLDSLYDGTEDTGIVSNGLDSKGGRLTILHNEERVVPRVLNKQLLSAGMSNKDLVDNALYGQMMKKQTLNMDHYEKQASELNKATHKTDTTINFAPLEHQMRRVELAIKNQPKVEEKMEEWTENAVEISKRVTKGMMTTLEKRKVYL